jgi:hypothetical protein
MFRLAEALDARLLATSARTRVAVVVLTVVTMIGGALPQVPRAYLDYSGLPLLNRIEQHETYGPDTISDMYGAKVTLNDVGDMYTKTRLDQTPLEAATWSKEASAPYPPAALLIHAAIFAIGAATGVGFYGMILALACLFLALSLAYFLKTRWYLFPLLYLNFSYVAYRFVYVQDGTYLVMLVVLMTALFLARGGHAATHALMALGITIKLSPLYYAKNVLRMKPASAYLFAAIVLAGLVAPYFIWENYLYIYRFQNELKGGSWANALGALALVLPFTVALWYVETRLDFDLEDRVGWGTVPFALLLAITLNTARHLVLVLLVPDKRGARNLAAAIGLGLHALFPSVIRQGSVVYIAFAVLIAALAYYLDRIGWDTVRDDMRHPARTGRMMIAGLRLEPIS